MKNLNFLTIFVIVIMNIVPFFSLQGQEVTCVVGDTIFYADRGRINEPIKIFEVKIDGIKDTGWYLALVHFYVGKKSSFTFKKMRDVKFMVNGVVSNAINFQGDTLDYVEVVFAHRDTADQTAVELPKKQILIKGKMTLAVYGILDTSEIVWGDIMKLWMDIVFYGPKTNDYKVFFEIGPAYTIYKLTSGISNEPPKNFSIGPNPFSNQLYIKSDKREKITIYDCYGKVMYQGKEQEIETSNWIPGIYIIYQENNFTRKVIKI